MAVIREHLANKGLGLHNDLQDESSIVGNFPVALLLHRFGTKEQKERYLEGMFTGKERIAFGLTEPDHGSDATFLETTAVKQGSDWVINGMKRFNTGMHTATVDLVFARVVHREQLAVGLAHDLLAAVAVQALGALGPFGDHAVFVHEIHAVVLHRVHHQAVALLAGG